MLQGHALRASIVVSYGKFATNSKKNIQFRIFALSGLKITAGQRSMTSQIFKMTGQICFTSVIVTGHICYNF